MKSGVCPKDLLNAKKYTKTHQRKVSTYSVARHGHAGNLTPVTVIEILCEAQSVAGWEGVRPVVCLGTGEWATETACC
jgi:hypothetical protein